MPQSDPVLQCIFCRDEVLMQTHASSVKNRGAVRSCSDSTSCPGALHFPFHKSQITANRQQKAGLEAVSRWPCFKPWRGCHKRGTREAKSFQLSFPGRFMQTRQSRIRLIRAKDESSTATAHLMQISDGLEIVL